MHTSRLLAVVFALCATLGLAACGSGSSSTAGTTTETTMSATAHGGEAGSTDSGGKKMPAKPAGTGKDQGGGGRSGSGGEAHFTPVPHHDSGGGAGKFEETGGDNSIQRYGSEPSSSEFAAAAEALHDYLDARAQRAWGAACSYMQAGVARSLAQLGGGKAAPCPQLLAALSAGLPPRALREAAVADIGALRAEGSRGFLLFTGAQGTHYFMPMAREGGEWKVAAIAPSAIS